MSKDKDFSLNTSLQSIQSTIGSTYDERDYFVYPYRYVILASFTIINVAQSWVCNTLGAIQIQTSHFYDVPVVVVTLCAISYLILNVPFNFIANLVIERKGIYTSILIGVILLLIGAWTRCLVNSVGFYMFIIGTIITAVGQPFLLNAPAKIAAVWFGPDQRDIATTLGVLASPIGGIGGFVLPSFFNFSDNDKPELYHKGREEFESYIMWQNIFVTALCIMMIFMRSKPPTPPSASENQEKMPFKQSLVELTSNKNYIKLVITFALVYANYQVLTTCMGQMTSPWDYKSGDNSIFGAVSIVGGLIGAFTTGMLLDKTKKYKYALSISTFGTAVMVVLGSLSFITKNLIVSCIAVFILGIFIVTILPVGFGFASEITFPIDESQSTGCMLMVAQVVSTLATLLVSYLLGINFWTGATAIYIIAGLGAFFSLIVKEDLQKQQFEKKLRLLQDQQKIKI